MQHAFEKSLLYFAQVWFGVASLYFLTGQKRNNEIASDFGGSKTISNSDRFEQIRSWNLDQSLKS